MKFEPKVKRTKMFVYSAHVLESFMKLNKYLE